MIRELVTDPELLSTPCEEATADDAQIALDLAETLESIEDAACLAANQIGYTKRIVALKDDTETALVFYNPSMSRALYPSKMVEECLTCPEPHKVTRFAKMTVHFQVLIDGELKNRKVELKDWPAQLMQHMIDHCNGKYL